MNIKREVYPRENNEFASVYVIHDDLGVVSRLSPSDAWELLEQLDKHRSQIFRDMHPESAKPKTFLQQTKPDETTRFRASWLDDLDS